MKHHCSVPGCEESACMLLIAKPSGMKDRHLDFRFCLRHGTEYRAIGYRDSAADVGVSMYDES